MKTASWAEILARLNGTLDLCRGLGLDDHVEGSRFLEYREHLFRLIKALEGGGQAGARKVFEADQLFSAVVLTESTELGDLEPFLQTVDPKIAAEKLVHILGGPLLPSDEDSNSNQPRNLLFELNLAARLWRAGFPPELGEHPDLAIVVGERRFLIQCKRPFSQRSARRCFDDARAQLRGDLANAPTGSRGVIALSLSRLFHPGDQLFVYSSEKQARRQMGDSLVALEQEIVGEQYPGSEFAGLIGHIMTAGFDEGAGLWVAIQHTVVHSFSATGSPDDAALQSIYRGFERNWY